MKKILNQESKKIKTDLLSLGSDLEKISYSSLKENISFIDQSYKNISLKSTPKWRLVFKPLYLSSLFIGIILIIIIIKINKSEPVYPVKYNNYEMLQYGTDLGMYNAGIYNTNDTFTDKFLRFLGQHKASPEKIIKYGEYLKKDFNFNLITKKKQNETENFLQQTFKGFNGYIESIFKEQKRIEIKGKIPATSIDGLRYSLKNFVQEDKYFQEQETAISRTPDLIVIDQKIKEVEESILYLKEAIQKETILSKRIELAKKLKENESYLNERKGVKKNITDQINFTDVKISISLLPSFWQSLSREDLLYFYAGWTSPSLWTILKVNIFYSLILLLKILSYVFWIIPLIIYLAWKKYQEKKLLDELE